VASSSQGLPKEVPVNLRKLPKGPGSQPKRREDLGRAWLIRPEVEL